MRTLLLVSLTLIIAACSSDSMSNGNKEVLNMFGPFEFEVTNSAEKGKVQTIKFANPRYLSDSTNRPGIAGATVLALYRNLSEEERTSINAYEILFGAGEKTFRYELSQSAVKELYTLSQKTDAVASKMFTRQYSDLIADTDTSVFKISPDSIQKSFSLGVPDSLPVDSLRIYAAYPTTIKSLRDSTMKVFRYSALVYQQKKTYYFYCTINRANQRITGLRVIPKKDQREFALPL